MESGDIVEWEGKKYTIIKFIGDDIIEAEPLDKYKSWMEYLFKKNYNMSVTYYIYIDQLEGDEDDEDKEKRAFKRLIFRDGSFICTC